ncbi:MAG TPA: hypothetical protein VFF81_02105 [Noviherbaspirillum sp.]|nr:hypothetical protein [Noviherbaspirillum sp.]
MESLRFDRAFLRLFAAPLVWALHFLAVYGAIGIICARRMHGLTLLGLDIASWVVAATTVASVAAVFLLSLRGAAGQPPQDNASFTRWTGAALGVLSIIAIAWEAMAILLVPACR